MAVDNLETHRVTFHNVYLGGWDMGTDRNVNCYSPLRKKISWEPCSACVSPQRSRRASPFGKNVLDDKQLQTFVIEEVVIGDKNVARLQNIVHYLYSYRRPNILCTHRYSILVADPYAA